MTFKMMASLITAAALTVSAPALAKDCTGLEGKDLKTCEKENKQDDRSVAYMPSKLDGSLSAYDAAEKNPFATDAYRVRVTEAGLTSVDGYLEKAFRLQATMQFAKFVVDEAGKGNADVLKLAPTLKPIVEKAIADAQGLVTEGQALVTTGVPNEIKADPKLAMKGPKALTALKDGLTALESTVKSAPEIGKSLAALVP